ncbi:unnamed protein product [Ambrosiozyma monospora]|uniref:Unnamed protein product n=1 Tax=Ambrosiozyma monospora TaxID=43982 RepID=A0ACB5TZ96_AMBMO|nr:unnamed protein product [Ambrosiozyma monospora]
MILISRGLKLVSLEFRVAVQVVLFNNLKTIYVENDPTVWEGGSADWRMGMQSAVAWTRERKQKYDQSIKLVIRLSHWDILSNAKLNQIFKKADNFESCINY